MKKFLIPLVLFFGLVIFLALGLQRDPQAIPSPLVDKPAPAFSLPRISGSFSGINLPKTVPHTATGANPQQPTQRTDSMLNSPSSVTWLTPMPSMFSSS